MLISLKFRVTLVIIDAHLLIHQSVCLFVYLFICFSEHILKGRCSRLQERQIKKKKGKQKSPGEGQKSLTSWLTKK